MWHGYLLSDTGSNVFTRELVKALSRGGHEIVLFSQDPAAERIMGDAAECRRPRLPGHLPVFVLDRYPDLDAKHVSDLSDEELGAYIIANVDAVVEVLEGTGDAFLFCNHVVLGGLVGAGVKERTGLPFGAYAHGSELEYALRRDRSLAVRGRAALDEAAVVFSGSDHTSSVLREVLGAGLYEDRIEILPPGVDTRNFHPSRGSMDALLSTLGGVDRGERGPDPDAADKLGSVERFVLYAGKLMEQKGVGTLLEAWGRIHHDFPGIDLVVVGFGDERQRLESQAAGLPVVFTGGFSHEELQMLMPLAQTVVVPSILAEAFGMIAAEAASSGVVPLVADHSGLAEVAAGLGDAVVTFDGSPEDLAGKLASLLRMPAAERRDLGAVARRRAVERWSWDSVAGRFGSIVEGRL